MRRADQRKFHYIYKITRDDGRFYIGMHSTDDLDDGYFGSGKLLMASVKKHGKEKHSKEILEFLPSREALKLREKELVTEELLGDKRCMNLKLGGEGGGSGNFTKACQQKGLQKFLELMKDQTFKEKHSLATRKGVIAAIENGLIPFNGKGKTSFLGKRHSAATKEKISKLMFGKQSGEKNSQYGKKWMTNESISIKVNGADVQAFIEKGFRLGRVSKSPKP